mmetsp:Transcript_113967/g.363427  ORF Transcript_113967/g.363427 Transcript_113967/m.363427 type:complete len:116 (+) Transcript_113967:402-749(+)
MAPVPAPQYHQAQSPATMCQAPRRPGMSPLTSPARAQAALAAPAALAGLNWSWLLTDQGLLPAKQAVAPAARWVRRAAPVASAAAPPAALVAVRGAECSSCSPSRQGAVVHENRE